MVVMDLTQVMFEFMNILEVPGLSWVSDIDGEAANDFSGSSVSLNADGDRVAIGASANRW